MTQNQSAVYSVAALHTANDEIKGDIFVVICDGIKRDLKFVEFANIKFDEYDAQKSIAFENEIEFNDGCFSQYTFTIVLYMQPYKAFKAKY